jgi:hypothetical protein
MRPGRGIGNNGPLGGACGTTAGRRGAVPFPYKGTPTGGSAFRSAPVEPALGMALYVRAVPTSPRRSLSERP